MSSASPPSTPRAKQFHLYSLHFYKIKSRFPLPMSEATIKNDPSGGRFSIP